VDLPLIEHWNGKAWKVVSTPDRFRNGGWLAGVIATSASNVWAVGRYEGTRDVSRLLIEHWTGHGWKIAPTANPVGAEWGGWFYQVAAASPKDVWAVGAYGDVATGPYGQVALFEHWNGKAWKQIPAPDNGVFGGVAAVSATSAWAVGYGGAGTDPKRISRTGTAKPGRRCRAPTGKRRSGRGSRFTRI
jgi:hypothetical protein